MGKQKIYREIGVVLTYYDHGDAELFIPHWNGECYLSSEHFEDALIDAIVTFLMNSMLCREPFLLQVNKGERTHGKYRKIGDIMQHDHDNG